MLMNKWGVQLCMKKIKTSRNVPNVTGEQYRKVGVDQDVMLKLISCQRRSLFCSVDPTVATTLPILSWVWKSVSHRKVVFTFSWQSQWKGLNRWKIIKFETWPWWRVWEKKQGPLAYLCKVERKEGTQSVCVCCSSGPVCTDGWKNARWGGVCVCLCVCGCMCERQASSCSGGRLFLHIVWTSIDDEQVRAGKRTESKMGTLAFVCVSPWHKAADTIKHHELVTWRMKKKIKLLDSKLSN